MHEHKVGGKPQTAVEFFPRGMELALRVPAEFSRVDEDHQSSP